jgi:hypothetical protein
MKSPLIERDNPSPGGGLRWPATVLAVISAVLAVLAFARVMSPPAALWPPLVIVLLVFSILFWSAIAVVQWRLWRSQGPAGQKISAATVYSRQGQLFIHPQTRTWNNIGWNSEPVTKIAASASRSMIGETVRRALLSSRSDARTADAVDGPENPVLKAAGVTTWKTFNRGVSLVGITMENEQIAVYAYRAARRSEGKGFIVLDDGQVTLTPDCTDDQLANAVFDALARSTASD